MKALRLVSEGAPFKVEHLDEDRFIILVENDQFYDRPDLGHDPYLGIEITARIP